MNQSKTQRYLTTATNIVVLLASIAIIYTCAWSYLKASSKPQLPLGLHKGQILAPLPSYNYSSASQHLIIAINPNCAYCNESVPFYHELTSVQQPPDQPTQIIASFQVPLDEANQYIKQQQLDISAIAAVDFRSINVSATPTIILTNGNGMVKDFWIGQLSDEVKGQIIKAIAMPSAKSIS